MSQSEYCLHPLPPPAASRPHHPECRPSDCDEAGHHPGVRQTPGPAGHGGQRLRLLRASRQVAQEAERETERQREAALKEDIRSAIDPWNIFLLFFNHVVLYLYIKMLILC